MRLYFFRSSTKIPVKEIEYVANKISYIFGIDYSIFTGPIIGGIDNVTMEHLLKVSDYFLARNEPVVAIVFTLENVDDVDILGEASQLDRGAWVKWSNDLTRVTLTVAHELGHLCDACHCTNESCIMFYAYREHKDLSFNSIFCEKCRSTIKNSWVYNRLTQASEDRARRGQRLQKVIDSIPLNLTNEVNKNFQKTISNNELTYPIAEPFPDWILASIDKMEFIRRVRKHFGYEERRNKEI